MHLVNNGSEAREQRSWQFICATEMPEQPPSSEALCRSPAGVAWMDGEHRLTLLLGWCCSVSIFYARLANGIIIHTHTHTKAWYIQGRLIHGLVASKEVLGKESGGGGSVVECLLSRGPVVCPLYCKGKWCRFRRTCHLLSADPRLVTVRRWLAPAKWREREDPGSV